MLLRRTVLPLILSLACALAAGPSHALDPDLVSAGVRWRFSNKDVLGHHQLEEFREADVWAMARLPWESYNASGWGVGTRLLGSAGVLRGGDVSALVVSVLPVLAFGTRDGRFNFDVGAGLALLSRSQFGQQDFGGNLQGSLTLGISVPLSRQFGVGYRFMHYSDAGVYGNDTTGADLHTLELIYRF